MGLGEALRSNSQRDATNEVTQMYPWTLGWQEPRLQRKTWFLED